MGLTIEIDSILIGIETRLGKKLVGQSRARTN
jgi:hypothetical protein